MKSETSNAKMGRVYKAKLALGLTMTLGTAGILVLNLNSTAMAATPLPPLLVEGQSEKTFVEHKVQPRETLWAISRKYGVSVEIIAHHNQIESNTKIKTGQTLEIPNQENIQTTSPKPVNSSLRDTTTAIPRPEAMEKQEPVLPLPLPEKEENKPIPIFIPSVLPTEAKVEPAESPSLNKAELEQSEEYAAIPEPILITPSENPIYRVKPGDTLNSIARLHGISLRELVAANNIDNPNLIEVEQELQIPGTHLVANTKAAQTSLISGITLPNNNITSGSASSEPQDLIVVVTTDENFEQNKPLDYLPEPKSITIPLQLESDRYVDKLRTDVQRMRQEYGQSGSERLAPREAEASRTAAVAQAQKPIEIHVPEPELLAQSNLKESNSQEQDSLATSPMEVEFYDRRREFPQGTTVAPELPPLLESEQYLPKNPPTFDGFNWPARGVLTSGYGWRWGRMHKGIDIAAPVGTPILAAAPGEVISSGWNNGGYGKLVKLEHPDGTVTLYAHNSKLMVREGQQVIQGEKIAEMGSTGYSTGPHLHFELHPPGKGAANPMAFLPKSRP